MVQSPSRRLSLQGFTLIELSIVLVIIGFIVGGVLVGQDLVHAAGVRAQITQIEKFNQAVNTFRSKYGYLPGDIPNPIAGQFGFAARGLYAGEGDGNGIIEGITQNTSGDNYGTRMGEEAAAFWSDLSYANGMNIGLIEGSYQSLPNAPSSNYAVTMMSSLMPVSKLGSGLFIHTYSYAGSNFYTLSAMDHTDWSSGVVSAAGLSVRDAYNIDKKMDDGLPQSGNVTAQLVCDGNGALNPVWAIGGWSASGVTCATANFVTSPAPYTTATQGNTTSCFDNSNTTGATQQYSIEENNGAGTNCALSFKFQ